MGKELNYVVCPDCKEVFDDYGKFEIKKTFLGYHLLVCSKCDLTFRYPSTIPHLKILVITILGLFLCSCLFALFVGIGVLVPVLLFAITIVIMSAITIKTLIGIFVDYSIKKRVPIDYKCRFYNTSKYSE